MAGEQEKRKHFILEQTAVAEAFRPRSGGGGGAKVPARDRQQHGAALLPPRRLRHGWRQN